MQETIHNAKTVLAFFLISLFFACSVRAEDSPERISVKQGADLVILATQGTSYEHAGFGVPKENNETFMVYQILAKYEGTAAWLAVNAWTGDVWNMNECSLLSNPELVKAQAEIRKKLSREDYDEAHRLRPYREYDLEPCP